MRSWVVERKFSLTVDKHKIHPDGDVSQKASKPHLQTHHIDTSSLVRHFKVLLNLKKLTIVLTQEKEIYHFIKQMISITAVKAA